jgi:outer membrane immunogenic protein
VKKHLLTTIALGALSLGALAFGALAAGPAAAADLSVRQPAYKAPPPVVVVDNWSGFYIGGSVGGAWLRADETFINNAAVADPLTFNSSSFIGGGHVGLQGQWGNWVLGIEGTFSGTNLNETVPSINPGFPRTRSAKVDDITTVVGKVGFASGPWMVYAKGGWADLRINTSSLNPLSGLSSSATNWYGGWTVGTGFEFMFWRNWVAGVEFDYYAAKFDHTQPFSNGQVGAVTSSRADVYAVTARLSYLFNWAAPFAGRY